VPRWLFLDVGEVSQLKKGGVVGQNVDLAGGELGECVGDARDGAMGNLRVGESDAEIGCVVAGHDDPPFRELFGAEIPEPVQVATIGFASVDRDENPAAVL
jgi:hypothetical protein